jgi:hypothetical protein
LGAPAAAAAGADLNYTRDMAKLGLARELGLTNANVAGAVGTNVAGAVGAGLSGGGGGGGGISISGPSGQLAQGSFGPSGFGGGGSSGGASSVAPPPFFDPYANRAWYQDRQSSDGAGLESIRGLASSISDQSDRRSQSILDSLASGRQQTQDTSAGIDADASATFSSLRGTQGDIMNNDALGQLDNSYRSGMSQLNNAFMVGQRDPRDIFGQVRGDIMAMQRPFLNASAAGMSDFYRNLGSSSRAAPIDGSQYINALNAAYTPYMRDLNERYGSATGNAMRLAANAGAGFNSGVSQLGSGLGATRSQLQGMFDSSAGGVLSQMYRSPAQQAQDAQAGSRVSQRAAIENRLLALQRLAPTAYRQRLGDRLRRDMNAL